MGKIIPGKIMREKTIQKEIMKLKLFITLCFALSVAACSTQIYHATGQYEDVAGVDRSILLQWKAQKYYIPLVTPEVDYGSVSLQAECIRDVFLDHENHAQYGLIFKERVQNFRLLESAPKIKVGNYIVCAKLKNSTSLTDIKVGDDIQLEVLCKAKSAASPILRANLDGYVLKAKESKTELVLGCPFQTAPVTNETRP